MWNTWVSPSISIAWENAVKSIEFRKPRKLVPIFSLAYGYFSSMTILWYILLPQRKCMAFPIKIHYTSSLVVFSQYYLCTCSKVYWFLKRKSKKNSFLKKKKKKEKTNSSHAGIQSKIYERVNGCNFIKNNENNVY